MRSTLLCLLQVGICISAVWAQTPVTPPQSTSITPIHFGMENLDPKADPCVDFYQYSCGGWIAAHPIPADEIYWDNSKILQRWNESLLHDVLEKVFSNDPKRSTIQQEIGDYYAACMDEKGVEVAGLRPIQPELDSIARIREKRQFAIQLAHLHKILMLLLSPGGFQASPTIWDPGSHEPLFGFFRVQDFDDASKVVAIADQGGLGLPDRDYYLKDDKDSKELRKKYVEHIRKTLVLAGDSSDPAQSANRIMEIETTLARSWMDVVKRRDFNNMNHKLSLRQLQELTPGFSWSDYLEALNVPPSEHYLVTVPEFFAALNRLLETVSLDDWKTYLRWYLLRAASPTLSERFVSEDFDFYQRVLLGQQSQAERWKRCVRATDHDLGDALGQAFVELTFRPEDKEQALKIAIALEQALSEDIEQLNWMTPPTKKEALTKLSLVTNRIGYPDKWNDYSRITIRRNDWTSDRFRASEYALTAKLNQIGKPVDRSEWDMTPPTVNMYASPQLNSINVPAGILAPPFYEVKMDAAVNFGGIGAAIGHEITHHFDNSGRKFDAHGNLRDWWTPEDSKQFENRAKCVSNQYSGYTATGNTKLNGALTLGENLADASGLRFAYMALKHKLESGETSTAKIDGLTPEQRLFLSYGLSWCGNLTPELLRDMASNDPHSPPQYRVNGVVSNTPEFQQAFSCKKGQPMVRENLCHVW